MSTSPSASRTRTVAASALLVVGLALLITHFALDAGSGREAPRGILWAAIAVSLAAVFVGVTNRKGR